MAPIVYFKSILWLIGFSGLGYGLLQLTPSAKGISPAVQYKTDNLSEESKKKKILLDKLQEATKSQPIYLKSVKKD